MRARAKIISVFFVLAIGYNVYPEGTTEKKELAQQCMRSQPVRFVENKGQITDVNGTPVPFVLFRGETPGINVYITEHGLTYVFTKTERDKKIEHEINISDPAHSPFINGKTEMVWVNVHLKGAKIDRRNILKEGQSEEHNNYFYSHCPQGIYDVFQYEKITVRDVYPGIDWVLYNSEKKGMKYDFVVHPGADPGQIKLIYESEQPITFDNGGNIQVKTRLGTLTEKAPYSYIKDTGIKIKCRFHKTSVDKYNTEISFRFTTSELSDEQTLIIDPQLVWATYYGGTSTEYSASSTMDSFQNFYTTGYTFSTDFLPSFITGTYYTQIGNANAGNNDVVILKFNNSGVLLWATYYGGTQFDSPYSMTCDISDNLYVAGNTQSADFPIQASTGYNDNTNAGSGDAFIIKFNSSGVRQWATFYGGSAGDACKSITTDNTGNVFATGYTSSTDFPVLNSGGYFNNTYAGGTDLFIIRFNAANTLLWSTYFGGSDYEDPWSIINDGTGNIYISAMTRSTNLPTLNSGGYFDNTLNGPSDCCILKFSNADNLLWSTYYGGSGDEVGGCLMKHANGNIYVAGSTSQSGAVAQPADFNTLNSGGYYDNTPGGRSDIYLLKFSNTETLLWATLFGGSGHESSLNYWSPYLDSDNCGNVFLSFSTKSPDLFTKQDVCNMGYFQSTFSNPLGLSWQCNLFLIKFTPADNILWATYIRGDGDDHVPSMVIDNQNNFFLGSTSDQTTLNNIFVNPGGGAYFDNQANGESDFAIYKFSPIPPTIGQSQVNSTACAPCNGSAAVTFSCGDGPYTYTWSNGTLQSSVTSATSSITGLCAGTYSVTATSNCNQTQTVTFTITGSTCGGITAYASDTTICSGTCATVTSNATGGSGTYTYSWSTGATTQNINPCPPVTTTYTVTVTDSGGNAATSTAVVTVNKINAQYTKGTANCSNCGCKEWIMVTGINGTPPYIYQWSDGHDKRYKNALCPGVYNVMVTDNNGCKTTVKVNAP